VKSDNYLKLLYAQILRGYSTVYQKDGGKLFIKHLNNSETAELNYIYEEAYEQAESCGLLSESKKLEELYLSGDYPKEKEIEIAEIRGLINNIYTALKKEILPSKKRAMKAQIKEKEDKLFDLLQEKDAFLGLTIEKFADRKFYRHSILSCFYKDPELKQPLFNEIDIDEVDDVEHFMDLYGTCIQEFTEENLKKIACSSFLLNCLICSDNAYEFFGIPTSKLTIFQLKLYHLGCRFRDIHKEMGDKIPKDILDDPDKLIEYFEKGQARTAIEGKAGDDETVGLMGATQEDLKELGVETNSKAQKTLMDELKQKGSLDIHDYIRIHGIG